MRPHQQCVPFFALIMAIAMMFGHGHAGWLKDASCQARCVRSVAERFDQSWTYKGTASAIAKCTSPYGSCGKFSRPCQPHCRLDAYPDCNSACWDAYTTPYL